MHNENTFYYQSELSDIFEQLRGLNTYDMKMLERITKDFFETFKNIKVTKSIDVINIHSIEKEKIGDFEYYINFIRDNGNWQLQMGNSLTYIKHTIKYIDSHESVYYLVDNYLALDIIERKINEHAGEQRVNFNAKTYYYKNNYWEPQIEHIKIYFEDISTHQIVVTESETNRLNKYPAYNKVSIPKKPQKVRSLKK